MKVDLPLKPRSGFTIVELLIVIVVIGILAAITIISFNGVSKNAVEAVMRADAENSAKLLANDFTVNNVYPTTIGAANSGKGLPKSGSNVYNYTFNNSTSPPSYSLTVTNTKSSNSYVVTNTSPNPTLSTQTPPAASPPTITNPLTNTAYYTDGCGGGASYYTFILYSVGSGTPSPTVQWQRMTPINTTTGSWVNISGATTASFTFNSSGILLYDGDYGLFRAIYTNSGGSTISPTVTFNLSNGC